MTIKFSSHKLIEKKQYGSPPTIMLTKAFFSTENKEWVRSLISAQLVVSISAIAVNDNKVSTIQNLAHLNVTPNHIQPVFEINQVFKSLAPHRSVGPIKQWEMEIEVRNLEFKRGEFLTIDIMDRDQVEKRVADWEKRVHNLIVEVKSWLPQNAGFIVKVGKKSPMHEGLMKDFDIGVRFLETADILRNNRIVMAIKPYGLWIMGANGRIDLMRANGALILIDEAEPFQKPKWKAYLQNERKNGVKFTKAVFQEVINQ